MKVYEKLMLDRAGLMEHGSITIVVFGDSISHAAFNEYIDFEKVYWNLLKKKLHAYRNYIPINVICSAIGGTTATKSLARLEKQVLAFPADLVIVCFGLNDVNGPLEDYLSSLSEIFSKCQARGFDVIFMTPNMMNTYVAQGTAEQHFEYAHKTADMQNGGKVDLYIESAAALAREMGVTVCDCYAKWKALAASGVDTTALLCNHINHPTEQMHELFADALYDIILAPLKGECEDGDQDTMYKEK